MDSLRLSNDDLIFLRDKAESVRSFHCPGTDLFGVKTCCAVFGFEPRFVRERMKPFKNRLDGNGEGVYRWHEYIQAMINTQE